MSKHLVDIDERALRAAREQLGSDTIKDTVNRALRQAAGIAPCGPIRQGTRDRCGAAWRRASLVFSEALRGAADIIIETTLVDRCLCLTAKMTKADTLTRR